MRGRTVCCTRRRGKPRLYTKVVVVQLVEKVFFRGGNRRRDDFFRRLLGGYGTVFKNVNYGGYGRF
jgi:hypothetical protein